MIHWEDHLRITNANWQQIQLAINSTAHTSILVMSIDRVLWNGAIFLKLV
jgi:hypothetical protein